MKSILRRLRPSPAMVVACMALLFAMTGAGYAAGMLGPNTVGTKQLKRNAVISSKVKNRSLLAVDFKAGQLPQGRRAPPVRPVRRARPVPQAPRARPAVEPVCGHLAIARCRARPDVPQRNRLGGHSSAGRHLLHHATRGRQPGHVGHLLDGRLGNSLGSDLLAYWVKLTPFAPCAAGQFQVRTYNFPGGAAALTNNVSFVIEIL